MKFRQKAPYRYFDCKGYAHKLIIIDTKNDKGNSIFYNENFRRGTRVWYLTEMAVKEYTKEITRNQAKLLYPNCP